MIRDKGYHPKIGFAELAALIERAVDEIETRRAEDDRRAA
jgi:hypothetical protein